MCPYKANIKKDLVTKTGTKASIKGTNLVVESIHIERSAGVHYAYASNRPIVAPSHTRICVELKNFFNPTGKNQQSMMDYLGEGLDIKAIIESQTQKTDVTLTDCRVVEVRNDMLPSGQVVETVKLEGISSKIEVEEVKKKLPFIFR